MSVLTASWQLTRCLERLPFALLLRLLTADLDRRLLQRLRARHDFDDLARDRRLAHLVHVQRQLVDHLAELRVAASIAVICAA